MKAQRITASQHFLNDRSNRLTFILTHTDLSDLTVVLERKFPDKRECVTADGVILVKAIETEFLITAYVATLDKVYAMYKSAGMDVPPSLKKLTYRVFKEPMPFIPLSSLSSFLFWVSDIKD